MKVEIGEYLRLNNGYIYQWESNDYECIYEEDGQLVYGNGANEYEWESDIIKHSFNIIDLVEYMDLLWLEHPIKLYDSDTTIGLFNPVRCDGFTTFEDGTHCIILNLDYIVDIKDLKIKGIITHEQIESMEYKVKE